jgi:hypothetical protein
MSVWMLATTQQRGYSFMQPAPNVTQQDVERIIRRDFPAESFSEIMAILNTYDKWEADRVRLAAMKLANGHIDDLRRAIEAAKGEYRDVLCAAEYSGYATESLRQGGLSCEEEQKIIDEDWKEYQDWFLR